MSLPRWIRNLGDIGKAPMQPPDVSRLDRMDGVTGEVPPEHVQRALALLFEQWSPAQMNEAAARIQRDLFRMCDVCDYIPEDPTLTVVTHHPTGAHVVTDLYDRTRVIPAVPVETVYDQDMPFASEVEAWLAGGAK